jgi:hypothetical protein
MRPGSVVVLDVALYNSPQMGFAQDDDVIHTLTADRTDHTLGIGILPGRAWCDDHFIDAHVPNSAAKVVAIDPIAVSDKILRLATVGGKGFNDLLRCPHGRRVHGHVEVDDAPSAMGQDNEAKQQPEGSRRNDEEVAGRGAVEMVLEERFPTLGRRTCAMPDHVLCDRGIHNIVAKEVKLSLDSRCSPKRILLGNSTDQLSDLWIDLRPASIPRFPSPVEFEALTVPANHGVRLDNHEAGTPVLP